MRARDNFIDIGSMLVNLHKVQAITRDNNKKCFGIILDYKYKGSHNFYNGMFYVCQNNDNESYERVRRVYDNDR